MGLTNDREFTNQTLPGVRIITDIERVKRQRSLLSVYGQGGFLKIKLFSLTHLLPFRRFFFSLCGFSYLISAVSFSK